MGWLKEVIVKQQYWTLLSEKWRRVDTEKTSTVEETWQEIMDTYTETALDWEVLDFVRRQRKVS